MLRGLNGPSYFCYFELHKLHEFQPIFEMRYLDLLKLRFSEGELQHCDVMLKDMRDSERMDYIVFNKLVRFINFSNFFSFLIYSNTISVDNFNILLIFSFQIHQNSSVAIINKNGYISEFSY